MCQLPSCNLFTQHYIVLWRDTSSELWTPVLLFNIAIQPTSCFPVFLLQTILFPFDTINHLFSARPVGLTTSLSSWGKVIWLCCAGLYFNLGVILVSFWFNNLGFILREILTAVYIITLLLGRPASIKEFLALLPGRQSDTHRNFSPSSPPRICGTVKKKKISTRGVLHIQSLYFVFVLLSFFSFVLFASYRKTQKN